MPTLMTKSPGSLKVVADTFPTTGPVFRGDAAKRARCFLTMLPIRLQVRLAEVETATGIPDSTYSDLVCTLRCRPIPAQLVGRLAQHYGCEASFDADDILRGIEDPAAVKCISTLEWLFGQAFAPTRGGYAELSYRLRPIEGSVHELGLASCTVPWQLCRPGVARFLDRHLTADGRRRAREFARPLAYMPEQDDRPRLVALLDSIVLDDLADRRGSFHGLAVAYAAQQLRFLQQLHDPESGIRLPVRRSLSVRESWPHSWRALRSLTFYDDHTVLRQYFSGYWTLHSGHQLWENEWVANEYRAFALRVAAADDDVELSMWLNRLRESSSLIAGAAT